jgi:hypothetical protein
MAATTIVRDRMLLKGGVTSSNLVGCAVSGDDENYVYAIAL